MYKSRIPTPHSKLGDIVAPFQLVAWNALFRIRHWLGVRDITLTPDLYPDGTKTPQVLSWTGEDYFPFWRRLLQVTIFADGDEPTRDQLATLMELIEHKEYLRPKVEAQILDYYHVCQFGTASVDEIVVDGSDEYAPQVFSLSQLRRTLYGPSIYLERDDNDNNEDNAFTLHFGCDWDIEHGLTVEFCDWEIVRID